MEGIEIWKYACVFSEPPEDREIETQEIGDSSLPELRTAEELPFLMSKETRKFFLRQPHLISLDCDLWETNANLFSFGF